MGIVWDNINFVDVESALGVDIDGIACTMVVKDEGYTLCWSLGIKGKGPGDLTLPVVDETVRDVARIIRLYLRDTLDVEFKPDDGT